MYNNEKGNIPAQPTSVSLTTTADVYATLTCSATPPSGTTLQYAFAKNNVYGVYSTSANFDCSSVGNACKVGDIIKCKAQSISSSSVRSNEVESTPTTISLPLGLVTYYKFDSGALTTDSSGLGHTISANTGTQLTSGQKFGSGAVNYASGQFSTMPTTGMSFPQGTIEFWVKPTWSGADGVGHNFWQTGDVGAANTGNWLAFFKWASNNLFWRQDSPLGCCQDNNAYIVSNADIPANTWTHLSVTWTNTQSKIYINGVLKSTAGLPQPPNAIDTIATIGKGPHGESLAAFDDFAFYNRALRDDEVAKHALKPPAG